MAIKIEYQDVVRKPNPMVNLNPLQTQDGKNGQPSGSC